MNVKYEPYENLYEKAAEELRLGINDLAQRAPGDSPIEKLFLSALITYVRSRVRQIGDIHVTNNLDGIDKYTKRETYGWGDYFIIVSPQTQFAFGRVDFLIMAFDEGKISGKKGWRGLVVECDGHDFHERTKEQAANDRSRDRQAQQAGLEIFRFTGAELWSDPWRCAEEVYEWAEKLLER